MEPPAPLEPNASDASSVYLSSGNISAHYRYRADILSALWGGSFRAFMEPPAPLKPNASTAFIVNLSSGTVSPTNYDRRFNYSALCSGSF